MPRKETSSSEVWFCFEARASLGKKKTGSLMKFVASNFERLARKLDPGHILSK
eukprot:CAMPEP_0206522584 /NCGR_PEP_ID=MMETSP0324_2-20121206/67069_1 /ASSEMBLY_ACC=CAM_ASM_000836 /TAXON_ID=2866 /ORGANISM="Crypthecodinium cohnii, Strain Seligo" /LENGTH=52 /DNA_ID=CAMNT_0054016775 /DNA_START=403 /DNA_END=558 /DNA_ORIENTATION=-